MDRPSDHWTGYGRLKPDSKLYQEIQSALSVPDFDYLKERAIATRGKALGTVPNHLGISINLDRFTWGFENVVVEIAFSDGIFWIARFPRITPKQDESRERSVALLSEIATMSLVRTRTAIPVPQVFDYETSSDNRFGRDFVLMECLKGRKLDGPIARTVPEEHLPKVAKQFADILIELQSVAFDRIGRIWCGEAGTQEPGLIGDEGEEAAKQQSSLDYFYRQRQEENREAMEAHPKDVDWWTACSVLKIALPHFIAEDMISGPFPLCHLDFHYGNLLFDEQYNLTGVIDWSAVQTVPFERLAVTPELITAPGLSAEENRPIVKFKDLVVASLRRNEAKGLSVDDKAEDGELPQMHAFSDFLASNRAEIVHRCTYSRPQRALWDGKLVARLIYGETVNWEQLKEVYGSGQYC